jgi:protein O-mannosyl-transferase
MKKIIQQSGKESKLLLINKSGNRIDNIINNYFNVFSFVIIILAGIVVYSNSFDCSFHFDDRFSISDNPQIRDFSRFTDLNNWLYPSRQLANLSFSLNYYFNHNNVFYYHLINLIVHIITGIFSFFLIKLILNFNNSTNLKLNKYKNWLALFSALFFIVHPLQTQAVTYIVQRMASMAAMFYIISIYLYAIARIEHTQKNNIIKAIIFYILGLISGIMGVMTKENAATFPFAMLLFEFFFVRTKENKIFRNYIVISLTVFVIICITYLLLNPSILASGATGGLKISSIDYLINQFVVIVRYLQLTILPINQCADYGSVSLNFPFILTFWNLKVIGSLLLLVGILVLAIYFYKKNKALSFGLFWFFLTLSVESSIIPIADPMFEHRMYLPMLGIGLFLIISLFLILNKLKSIYIFSILSVLIIILGYSCYSRNRIWKNDMTLWSDVIKTATNNARGYNNLAVEYQKKDFLKAEKLYLKAIEEKADFAGPIAGLASIYDTLQIYDKAIIYYNKAISYEPQNYEFLNKLGVVYGHIGNMDSSLKYFNQALDINPSYMGANDNLANAYAIKKDYNKALELFKKSILYDSTDQVPYRNLANIYTDLGDFEQALAMHRKVLENTPKDPDAYYNLGLTYSKMNNHSDAIESFQKCIDIDSSYYNAYNYTGNEYYSMGEYEKSIPYYEKTISLNPKYLLSYRNLALVYEKMGKDNLKIETYKLAARQGDMEIQKLLYGQNIKW